MSPRVQADAHRLRVLLVDDEPDNVALLTRILQRAYVVRTATSGSEALVMLDEEAADIIITDQRMPEMSGTEFLGKSMQLCPNAIRIIVSGYSDLQATLEAVNVAHASGFLQKPIKAEALETAIARAVEVKSQSISNSQAVKDLIDRNDALQRRIAQLEGELGDR